MDFPVEKKAEKKLNSPPSSKKPKKSLLKNVKTLAHDAKSAVAQWWSPANQTPLQPAQPIDGTPSTIFLEQELQAKMATFSFDSTTLSSEDNKIPFNNRTTLLRKRLFLNKEEYPKLYEDAYQQLAKFEIEMGQYNKTKEFNPDIEKPKYVHEPTIQLSHDGLALLSHLYAQKDGLPKQPIVVKTFEGFEKIVTFVDDSPNGVSVTLIVQFDKAFIRYLGKDIHKIAMRLEKIDSEIHAIYLDSVAASHTLTFATLKLSAFIKEIALKNRKEKTILHTYIAKTENEVSRQTDKFQCSVFATKDARELNRDNNSILFLKQLNQGIFAKNDTEHYCALPAKYLKGMQSRTHQKAALAKFGDEVVTRKELTLKAVYLKHPDQSYIPHFSKKYETLVIQCVNSLTDAQLDEAIGNYRAETITPERLQAVYGNNAVMKKA